MATDKLVQAGKSTSAKNLRAELGDRGSFSTILEHRDAYLGQQPVPTTAPGIALPEHLMQLLAKEVGRLAGERTASIDLALEDARGSVSALLEENQRLEQQVLQLDDELQRALKENAEQSGAQSELRVQLRDLSAQAGEARLQAEAARQESTLRGERLAASEQRCSRLEGALKASEDEVHSLREKLDQALLDAAGARSDARALSVELASKSDAEAALDDSRRQAQEQQRHLETARERLSAVEAERAGLDARVGELKEALTRSETRVQALLNGVLAGQSPAERIGAKAKPHSNS